jgi:hypothetical protein
MPVPDVIRRLLGRESPETGADDATVSVPGDVEEIDRERVARLARNSRDSRVTESLLAGDDGYTRAPPVSYLDDEFPQYALLGGRLWFGEEITARADEVPSRRTVVLITDERILLLVGKRTADTAFGVPFEGVDLVNVKYGEHESYLVVEADYKDTPQTFFLELHDPVDPERFDEITNYCNAR